MIIFFKIILLTMIGRVVCYEYIDTCSSITAFNSRCKDLENMLVDSKQGVPIIGSISLLFNSFGLISHAQKIKLIVENDRQQLKYERLLWSNEKGYKNTVKKIKSRIFFLSAFSMGFLFNLLKKRDGFNYWGSLIATSDTVLSCVLYVLISKVAWQIKKITSKPIPKYINASNLQDAQSD